MFLFDHLKEGSFRTAYADTDSMCLGLTKTRPLRPNMTREEEYRAIFDPIVKDEMRESWEKTWKNWFVTTTEVEDERFPGKLKRRFFELKSYKKPNIQANLDFNVGASLPSPRNVTTHWIWMMDL